MINKFTIDNVCKNLKFVDKNRGINIFKSFIRCGGVTTYLIFLAKCVQLSLFVIEVGILFVKKVRPLGNIQRFYYLKLFNSPITLPIIFKLLLDIDIQSSLL